MALNHKDDPNYVFGTTKQSAETIARSNPAISQGNGQITMSVFNKYIAEIINKVPEEFREQFS